MRVAFLTPEYVIDYPSSGGLASYVARMSRVLTTMGHTVEVFTLSDRPRVEDHDGVRVEHVRASTNTALRLLGGHWRSRLLFSGVIKQLSGARAMAAALHSRQSAAGFDLVQSSDYGLSGAFVPAQPGRVHAMRCSWSRRLYQQHAGQKDSVDTRTLAWLERNCVRRADVVYAPSRFMADALTQQFGVPVITIRPPLAEPPAGGTQEPVPSLPDKYIIHFGQLSPIKGTDVLLEALPAVCQRVEGFHLVIAGRASSPGITERLEAVRHLHNDRVTWLGPVPRQRLYATVQSARASVLPSRCDNLPNTVIESLALGTPVIGSNGASIDELVTDSVTGKLVPIGDTPALADAIVQQWNHPARFTAAELDRHATFAQMSPRRAAESLLGVVKKPSTHPLAEAA